MPSLWAWIVQTKHRFQSENLQCRWLKICSLFQFTSAKLLPWSRRWVAIISIAQPCYSVDTWCMCTKYIPSTPCWLRKRHFWKRKCTVILYNCILYCCAFLGLEAVKKLWQKSPLSYAKSRCTAHTARQMNPFIWWHNQSANTTDSFTEIRPRSVRHMLKMRGSDETGSGTGD